MDAYRPLLIAGLVVTEVAIWQWRMVIAHRGSRVSAMLLGIIGAVLQITAITQVIADVSLARGRAAHRPGRGLHDPGFAGAEFGLPIRPAKLPLAPDRLHQHNVSGGPPYGLILPGGSADGLFAAETTMPFVSHLDWVFSHGGFSGRTAPHHECHHPAQRSRRITSSGGRYLARVWRVLDRRCHERGDVPQRGVATRPRFAC